MSFKIKQINVLGLFDCYNYEGITLEDDFILFYGENGVGKTTLINIIFEFLSMNFYKKSSITRGLYKKMQIEFENEAKYEVEGNVFRVYDHNNLVYEENFENNCTLEMTNILENINNGVLYINDNRELINVTPNKKILKKNLVELVKEIENQFINEYRKCWQQNFHDFDEILVESIRRASTDKMSEEDVTNLIEDKDNIIKENNEMIKYGLMRDDNNIGKINIDNIDKIKTKTNRSSVLNLLQFYNFYQTNNNANLKRLYNRIESLILEVNNYLVDKTIKFDIENGFYIVHEKTNRRIKIEWLSSGETNLLRILFSCMLTNDKSGIFFIDEPELSLNMKWLEQIEGSLQRISCNNKNIQFIICTHSFDIISQDMDRVYKFKG